MKKLVHFYTEEKQRLETELKATKNKLANLSIGLLYTSDAADE